MPSVSTAASVSIRTKKLRSLDFPVVEKNAQFKPVKSYFVREMTERLKPVSIHEYKDYAIFFRLFQRRCVETNKELKLYCRQLDPSTWLLIPKAAADKPPKKYLMENADFRTSGRYKLNAKRIEGGEILVLNEKEAHSTRRAWNANYQNRRKQGCRCLIERVNENAVVYVKHSGISDRL